MSRTQISKKILLDEIIEQSHQEKVEDVIFWALENYSITKSTNGSMIAYAIVERIIEAEKNNDAKLMNPEKIDSLNL